MTRKRRKTKAAPGSRAAVKFGPLENWIGFNVQTRLETTYDVLGRKLTERLLAVTHPVL